MFKLIWTLTPIHRISWSFKHTCILTFQSIQLLPSQTLQITTFLIRIVTSAQGCPMGKIQTLTMPSTFKLHHSHKLIPTFSTTQSKRLITNNFNILTLQLLVIMIVVQIMFRKQPDDIIITICAILFSAYKNLTTLNTTFL